MELLTSELKARLLENGRSRTQLRTALPAPRNALFQDYSEKREFARVS